AISAAEIDGAIRTNRRRRPNLAAGVQKPFARPVWFEGMQIPEEGAEIDRAVDPDRRRRITHITHASQQNRPLVGYRTRFGPPGLTNARQQGKGGGPGTTFVPHRRMARHIFSLFGPGIGGGGLGLSSFSPQACPPSAARGILGRRS